MWKCGGVEVERWRGGDGGGDGGRGGEWVWWGGGSGVAGGAGEGEVKNTATQISPT